MRYMVEGYNVVDLNIKDEDGFKIVLICPTAVSAKQEAELLNVQEECKRDD